MGKILFYIVLALFSVFLNFNAIYQNIDGENLLEEELSDVRIQLIGIQQKAIKSVDDLYDYSKTSSELDSLENELKREVSHPNRPGFGERSKTLYDKISSKESQLSGVESKYNSIANKINSIAITPLTLIDTTISTPFLIANYRRAIQKGVNSHNEIGSIMQNEMKESGFLFTKQFFKNDDLGKVNHTLSAISNIKNRSTQQRYSIYSALVFSIFIDLFPLLLSILTSSTKGNKRGRKSRSRWNNGGIHLRVM